MSLLVHASRCAGVDEAGRGALAGPVACAAVILPDGFDLAGIDDSKKLTRENREFQAERIKEGAAWSLALVPHDVIDEINILQATFLGMQMALDRLEIAPKRVLIDGNQVPKRRLPDARVTVEGSGQSACHNVELAPRETVVKGDGIYACIAAASIIAKTARDAFMRRAHGDFPEYGFDAHVGYSAPHHLNAIREMGGCAIHRRSYDPWRTMLEQPCLFGE